MTTLAEARESIYEAFKVGWSGETPFYYDNEIAKMDDDPWVRLVVRHNKGDQETLGAVGNRKFERGGLVIVQVFVPLDLALARADELASLVQDIFEGKTIENVRFHGVLTREIGPDTKWYQLNVEAPFYYNETK